MRERIESEGRKRSKEVENSMEGRRKREQRGIGEVQRDQGGWK